MTSKKLNLGCGTDIRAGWINLDFKELPGIDVIHDVEDLPLPFRDEEFNEILCQDVLEHISYIHVMRELHRILTHGGKLMIRVPHFTSDNNFIDPTHKNFFSFKTFEFFVKNSPLKKNYYFDYHFDKISLAKIDFNKGFFVYNYIVEAIINSHHRMKTIYEATLLSRLFPANNIIVELIK